MKNPTYIRLGQTAAKEIAMKDISEEARRIGTHNYINHNRNIMEFCKENHFISIIKL